MLCGALAELQGRLTEVEARLAAFSARIEAHAKSLPAAHQLLAIPGIGPLAASALAASNGNLRQYRSARHFASSLGLTPAEFSTGGRQQLRGITKRGDLYLRGLLVHGARAVLQFIDRHDDRLSRWAQQLLQTKPYNVVAVALANKMARIVRAVAVREQPYTRLAAG